MVNKKLRRQLWPLFGVIGTCMCLLGCIPQLALQQKTPLKVGVLANCDLGQKKLSEPKSHHCAEHLGLELIPLISEDEKRFGLMYVTELANNQGVVLMYETEAKRSIWMRNMKIAIDVLFVNSQGQVVQTYEKVPPCPEDLVNCPLYSADQAQYVIEVRSGFLQQQNIDWGRSLIVFKP